MILKDIEDVKLNFLNKIEKAKYLKKIVRSLVENEDFDNAQTKISEYKMIFPSDIEITSIETVMLIMKGQIDEAENYALEGLQQVPFHFDLNYNLGFIYQTKGKYQEAIDAFIMAGKVAIDEDDKKTIQNAVNEIIKIDNKLDLTMNEELNYKLFPLRTQNTTWIGEQLFKDHNEEGSIPLYYNEPIVNYPINLWNIYRTETLRGKIYTNQSISIDISEEVVIPVAIFKSGTPILITVDEKEYKFDNFIPNRYYYIPIESKGKIKIQCEDKFIVGNTIHLKQNKKNNVKMVLNLFIDGLSQEVIKSNSLRDLMPNTYEFFKVGTIFNNCYSNAEWTFVSVPTIFQGKYLANHKMFHPELPHTLRSEDKSIGSYFKNEDYFTFQSCGNWRKPPSYGYANDFDRMLYQSGTVGGELEHIIPSFLEQVRAFEERDHYVWLTFFELHKASDNVTPKISSQVLNNIDVKKVIMDSKKSVKKGYDEKKIDRYISELKRLDSYLAIIYDFIEKKYNNDEIIVSLFSDHGQAFIDDGDHILRNARTSVPFMIRGRGVPSAISSELMENVDILPTILEKASIPFDPQKLDGQVPISLGGKKIKEHVYSESIYPGSTYKAIIRDNEHSLTFESEGNVEQDGRFKLGDFSIKLENINSKEDETNENTEKIAKYFDIIISHIGSFLKI